MRTKILILGLIYLFLIINCSIEEPKEVQLLPEIKKFFDTYKEYGIAVNVENMPDWAQGKRMKISTTKGNFLFYLKDNEIESVYKYLKNGGREKIYQKKKKQISKKSILEYATIIEYPAKLRFTPNGKTVLAIIPVGTKLKILNKYIWKSPVHQVIWYKVKHKDETGWISEHTCKKIKALGNSINPAPRARRRGDLNEY